MKQFKEKAIELQAHMQGLVERKMEEVQIVKDMF